MHIPDGFLDVKTWAVMAAASAGAISLATRKTHRLLGERDVPALGMMGAFIFAAQMVNFPVAAGTSGHVIGAALAVATLGPWAGSLVMAAVVTIQALFFADGGLMAWGANVFNMAVLAPWLAYFVFRLFPIGKLAFLSIAAFLAGWVSVVGAAAATGLQLAVSGTAPVQVVLPAMLVWHVLIGIGEGAITAAVLAYLKRTERRPLAVMSAADKGV